MSQLRSLALNDPLLGRGTTRYSTQTLMLKRQSSETFCFSAQVIELFLANNEEHYIQIDFEPRGRYYALLFRGPRQPVIKIKLAAKASFIGAINDSFL